MAGAVPVGFYPEDHYKRPTSPLRYLKFFLLPFFLFLFPCKVLAIAWCTQSQTGLLVFHLFLLSSDQLHHNILKTLSLNKMRV